MSFKRWLKVRVKHYTVAVSGALLIGASLYFLFIGKMKLAGISFAIGLVLGFYGRYLGSERNRNDDW